MTVSDADWDAADPRLLRSLLSQIQLVRSFEETVLDLAAKGLVHGPAHSSIGQEGAAAGSIIGLESADLVNGSHRGHHQFLAKSLAHLVPEGIDPVAPLDDRVRVLMRRTLAEILGLAQGFCNGRGGSMHLRWAEAGALGTNAIVGGGVPPAAGAAWAHRHAGTENVVVSYFGDGAVNIGSVLETMNLAAAWKLPLCFFIENNGYAVSTSVAEVTGESRLSGRGPGFGIPSWRVDGMDPLAVHLAMTEALAHMRAGNGPTVIEAEVYRFFHQNGPFPGSAFGYRGKEEEAAWRARDPLALISHHLQRRELVDQDDLDNLRAAAEQAMASAVAELTEEEPGGREGKRRVRPDLWPRRDFVDVGIRSDLAEFADSRYEEADSFPHPMTERRFVDVVARVVERRMETDPSVVVLGEDVHRLKGGTNGATRGLAERFPDRVLGTPISENAFLGLAGGMATDGRFRPVVEFMYPDFVWVAADQAFNQVGKARHMFGGGTDVPLVLRTKVAIGTGYGSQHSMDPAGIFATNPGWRIVAPSTPFDYIGLMNTALASNDPVLVIEHSDLYPVSGLVPQDDFDYRIPIGSAAVRRTGSQVTVLTYLAMVAWSIEAVTATGIDAEVIDLRWLDRASIDWQTIEASVRKTGNVMIVEQGSRGTSYGGWLADELHRRCFDWLDQPIRRVTGAESAPSISRVLERAAHAGVEEISAALLAAVRDSGGH
ncbi:alpha-ketoacid dehydrogenase subunit alpha/beta [Yinghuangia aomiensis]|uniref:alpha-ketoacid dehydrogenase subunit alpha/beta n=1 Tax=Yinghuangia aomiensis TaxID=676205 RepID=UPI0031EAD542